MIEEKLLDFDYTVDPKGLRDKITISWDLATLQAYWNYPTPYNFSYEKHIKKREQKEAEDKLTDCKNKERQN